MDQALQKLHQNFPWICVWDDHESANDSYQDGAENHNAGEGQWADRNSLHKLHFLSGYQFDQKHLQTLRSLGSSITEILWI